MRATPELERFKFSRDTIDKLSAQNSTTVADSSLLDEKWLKQLGLPIRDRWTIMSLKNLPEINRCPVTSVSQLPVLKEPSPSRTKNQAKHTSANDPARIRARLLVAAPAQDHPVQI